MFFNNCSIFKELSLPSAATKIILPCNFCFVNNFFVISLFNLSLQSATFNIIAWLILSVNIVLSKKPPQFWDGFLRGENSCLSYIFNYLNTSFPLTSLLQKLALYHYCLGFCLIFLLPSQVLSEFFLGPYPYYLEFSSPTELYILLYSL